MKFYNGWNTSLIARIEAMRILDEQSASRGQYKEVSQQLYSLARQLFGEPTAGIELLTLDDVLNFYQYKEGDHPSLSLIIKQSHVLCKEMHISKKIYGVSAVCCIFMMQKKEHEIARSFFTVLMRPLVALYRTRTDAQRRGLQGGRPPSAHKVEGLRIAREFRAGNPSAPMVSVVNEVIARLTSTHTDAPSARTIKRWIIADEQSERPYA
ncbi:hypothetical protein D3C75_576500 [compost metagenome]